MVTDAQVKLLRQKMMEGKTQEAAAAAAGLSVRTAREWKDGPLPSEAKQPRDWRTRPDPFAVAWEERVVPLLLADKDGVLEATTVLAQLEEEQPGRFGLAQLRTLQRRIRDWRALHGPEREVYFEQEQIPGREAAIDFTHAKELGVTIQGQPFEHLLFVFVLAFSGWTWIKVALGETFEALVSGLQGALWALGGVPVVLRSDNLSAATHELKHSAGRSLNQRFAAVLLHLGLTSSRIRPGQAHENGVAEQANGRLKSLLVQALLLRGSTDFASVADWESFAREVVERRINRHVTPALSTERPLLRPLPSMPVPCYTRWTPIVRRWSTIRVGGRTYSVPSRLIGHQLAVHQYEDALEIFFKGHLVERVERLRGDKGHRIDYRHIIWSLVRKPGAFARYRFREELFPSLAFRRAYDHLRERFGERADVEYVRILHLAASTMEATVARTLEALLEAGVPFDYATVRGAADHGSPAVPAIAIPIPDPALYDQLLAGGAR